MVQNPLAAVYDVTLTNHFTPGGLVVGEGGGGAVDRGGFRVSCTVSLASGS